MSTVELGTNSTVEPGTNTNVNANEVLANRALSYEAACEVVVCAAEHLGVKP